MLFESINRYKKQLRLIALGLFGIIAIFLAINYSLLVVTSTDPGIKITGTISENSEAGNTPRKIRVGINVVKNKPARLDFSSGDRITTIYKEVRALRINRVSVSLAPQKSVSKISNIANEFTPACLFQASDDKNVFYECRNNTVYKYGISEEPQIITTGVYLVGRQYPYKNGFLSFTKPKTSDDQIAPVQLSYIDGDNVSIIAADASKYIDDYNGSIATTTDSDLFVITNRTDGIFYVFKNEKSKTITSYDFAKDLIKVDRSTINASLSKSFLFLNYTKNENKKAVEEASETIGVPVAIQYDIASDMKKMGEISFKNSVGSGTVNAVNDSTVYSLDISNKLIVSSLSNSSVKDVFVIYNTLASSVLNGCLYYVTDNRLYRYEPDSHTSYMERDLGGHNINFLSSFAGHLQFSGNSENSLSTTATYSLSSKEKLPNEPFDFFPYSLKELPILRSDFDKNKLYFWISLNSITYDRETGEGTFDQSEYTLKKDVVMRRIKSDGLNLSDYQVVFNPGF